ncbi:DUF748 domain-containing protein [Kaarinaea lacus]
MNFGLSNFLRHKWLFLLLLISLLVAIALAILPMVIQRMAVTWLEENGADRAAIGNIDLNIFTGRLGIFDVEVEKEEEIPLRIWRLTADVDLWHLIRKRFFVKTVWLYEANLQIKQQEDGSLEIGGIRLPLEPEATAEPQIDTTSPGILDRWGVGIDVFAIRNSTIRYRSSMLDERLDINSFYALNVFSWQPEQPARINFDLLVNKQPVTLLSDTRVFRETPDTRSTLEVSQLDLSHYESVAKQAGIDELKGFLSLSLVVDAIYDVDKKTHFTLDANVNLDDFRLRQGEILVEQKSLRYQTDITLKLPASPGQELGSSAGQLVVQDQTVNFESLRANFTELIWNGKAAFIAGDDGDKPPVFKVQGNLEVVDLEVDDEKAKLKLALVKKVAAKGIAVSLPNDVRVSEVSVSDLKALLQIEPGLNPELPEIGLKQGVFKNAQFDNEKQLVAVENMELTNLSAQTADKKLQLAHMRSMNVEQATVKLQESVSINAVTVSEAQALKAIVASGTPELEPAVNVFNTRVDNLQFQFNPQALALQSIKVDGLNLLAKREADGALYAINLLPKSNIEEPPVQEAPTSPTEEKPVAPFTFKFEQLIVGEDSIVRIVDHSVTPQFVANITPLNINVTHVDSANPESKTEFDMNTSLNTGNRILAKGWLTPFAEKRDADIKVDINALDLVMFSPYSVSAAGYKVRSGRVNVSLMGEIDDDAVKANTKIVAQRLNLDATSDEARGKSAQKLGIGMPIDAALAMMKDKKGNISIDVPVSGNLQDPNFAFGPAFRGAMTQAIKKASITYAAYALQPYGSILFGAQMLNKAMALRLESVRFDAGEDELDDRAKKYLEKIASLMNDRPGISLTLCGNATVSDRNELRSRNVNKLEEELITLAEQRGDNIRNYLISEHGIAADRFFDCQPEVTNDKSAQPEVRLGL